MERHLLLLALCMLAPSAAFAGPAADAVRFFYEPVRWEPDPAYRHLFVDPVRSVLELNDQAPEGEIGCIDFSPGIDAQDYDQATISQTLQLVERVNGSTAEVIATFELLPEDGTDREIRWTLAEANGEWKIADIESVTGGWTLSAFDCAPGN